MSTLGVNATHIIELERSHFVEPTEPNLRHVDSIQDNSLINIKIVFDNPYLKYVHTLFQKRYGTRIVNYQLSSCNSC